MIPAYRGSDMPCKHYLLSSPSPTKNLPTDQESDLRLFAIAQTGAP